MKLNESQKSTLNKKLEYRFRNSEVGKLLLEKVNTNVSLDKDEVITLVNKLEYRFKNSEVGKEFVKTLVK
jgi:hypothetical protein